MNVNTNTATDINNIKDTDDATSLLTDAVYDDGWFRIVSGFDHIKISLDDVFIRGI